MRGDHIYIRTTIAGIPFEHHGIDMGDGTVIHLAPSDGARVTLRDSTDRFTVRRDSIATFCRGQTAHPYQHAEALPGEQVAKRAEGMLGKQGYNLLHANCEHFASFCSTGRHESRQVDMGQNVLASATSMVTKAFWALSNRIGSRAVSHVSVKAAIKANPLLLAADGIELAALAIGCSSGLSARDNRNAARVTGTLAAAGIGAIVGGPPGALASVAVHNGSTLIAEQVCKHVRRVFS